MEADLPQEQLSERKNELRDAADIVPGAWLVLWAIRHRAGLLKRNEPADARFHDAFARNGVHDAAEAVEALVVIVGVTATRMIDVGCPHCPAVSADEYALVDACGVGARRGEWAARAILDGFLPPTAARHAARHAAAAGRALHVAGFGWRTPTQAECPSLRLAVESGLN